ncbi:hypothetical protein GCM10009566_19150 [Streptomyces murinus]
MDAGDVMAGFRGARGGDGGVDPAGHGGEDAEGALRGLSHNPSRVRAPEKSWAGLFMSGMGGITLIEDLRDE